MVLEKKSMDLDKFFGLKLFYRARKKVPKVCLFVALTPPKKEFVFTI